MSKDKDKQKTDLDSLGIKIYDWSTDETTEYKENEGGNDE